MDVVGKPVLVVRSSYLRKRRCISGVKLPQLHQRGALLEQFDGRRMS